jgi:hypothetical protein
MPLNGSPAQNVSFPEGTHGSWAKSESEAAVQVAEGRILKFVWQQICELYAIYRKVIVLYNVTQLYVDQESYKFSFQSQGDNESDMELRVSNLVWVQISGSQHCLVWSRIQIHK